MPDTSLFSLGLILVIFFLGGTVLSWITFFKVQGLQKKIAKLAKLVATKPASQSPAPAKAKTKPATSAQKKIATAASSKTAQPKPEGFFSALERSLSGNWLVWVGALVLALGGVLMVKYTIEVINFGPWLRLGTGVFAGIAMLASGHWLKQNTSLSAQKVRSAAPLALSAAGLITLYGAVYASYGLYHLVPAPFAFVVLAMIALAGLVLALIHGQVLALIGIGGGTVVPMLVQTDTPSALALFGYIFIVAGAGLVLAKIRNWRASGLAALASAFLWPMLWLDAVSADNLAGSDAIILSVFLLMLMVLALALAWHQPNDRYLSIPTMRKWPAAYLVAVGAAIITSIVFFFLARQSDHAPVMLIAFGVLCVGTLFAAGQHEGLAWVPVFPALASFFILLYWPTDQSGIITDTIRLNRFLGVPGAGPDGPPFVSTLIAFAALYGFGGYAAQTRLRVRGIMAAVSAFVPLALLFVAYWRVSGLQHDWQMSTLALVLSLAQVMVLERIIHHQGGIAARPGPAAAYALGCNGALALALAMSIGQVWLSVGLALQIPLMAFLWGRLKVPVLKLAALILAIVVVLRLTIFGEAFEQTIGDVPIFNWLLWGYGVPALALMAGAQIFVRAGAPRNAAVVQGLESAAIISAISLFMLEIHHFMSGGQMDAIPEFAERGLYVTAWLAIAVALQWRMGPKLRFAQRWGRRIMLVLAGTLLVFQISFNPWSGFASGIGKIPIFNPLALAYLFPGIMLVVQAVLYRSTGRIQSSVVSALCGLSVLLMWLIMEVRRAFHAPDLHLGAVSNGESYTYSAIVLGFALIILGAGFWRRQPYLRYTALALVVAVTFKIFVYDLSELRGLLRGLSFLGLGAVLMGIALFYQKTVLPAQAREREK